MGHVLKKEGNDWVKKSMEMTVEGSRGRGRPKMTWEKVVERDMKVRGLVRNDAKDGVKWRALSWGGKRLTPTTVGKLTSKCLFVLPVYSNEQGFCLFFHDSAFCCYNSSSSLAANFWFAGTLLMLDLA